MSAIYLIRCALITFLILICVSPSGPTRAQDRGLIVSGDAGRQVRVGRSYALVIGNNAYRNLRKLTTAESDAKAVEAILREQYGFETHLLLNATREQIISALNNYRRTLDQSANLLIYYAGHGVNDKEIDKAYWLPVDARNDFNANWISADDITSNIKGVPARHVLIISDSCYSGTIYRDLTVNLSIPVERARFLERMLDGRSRTLMASGGDEPVVDGGGGGHSVFARALLRGLTQMGKDAFTAAELFRDYVQESVAGQSNQTPEYNALRNSGHERGDFVFVKIKTDAKKTETTVKTPAAPIGDPAAFELEYWNAIKDSSDPEEYLDYLKRYPEGRFAEIARRRAAGGRRGGNTGGVTTDPTANKPNAPANARPLIYGLVVDNSVSTPSLNKIIEAGKVIISKNRAGDEACVVRFVDSNEIKVMQDFTADILALSDALQDMRTEGGQTAIIDAVYLSAEHVAARKKGAGGEHRRAIILITNGDDRASFYKKEQLLSGLLESGVKVYAIGLVNELGKSSQRDQAKRLLTEITGKTGGRVYFPNSLAELPRVVSEIMRELQDK